MEKENNAKQNAGNDISEEWIICSNCDFVMAGTWKERVHDGVWRIMSTAPAV